MPTTPATLDKTERTKQIGVSAGYLLGITA